jgi:hypothetical protein
MFIFIKNAIFNNENFLQAIIILSTIHTCIIRLIFVDHDQHV